MSNSFIRDDGPTLCEKLFDIAETEQEAEIQPDGVTDNFRWKAKAFIIGSSDVCFHAAILIHCSALFPS